MAWWKVKKQADWWQEETWPEEAWQEEAWQEEAPGAKKGPGSKKSSAKSGGKKGPGSKKERIKVLKDNLENEDLHGALLAAESLDKDVLKDAPLDQLLELAAKIAGPVQYGRVLAIFCKSGIQIDVPTFTKLLVSLTGRIPCSSGMVRLTLNMALSRSSQVVPLIPPNATSEQEQEVLEDGEPMDLPDAASSSDIVTGKNLPLLSLEHGPSSVVGTYDPRPLPQNHAGSPAAAKAVYRRRPHGQSLGPFAYFWQDRDKPDGYWQISWEIGGTDILGWHVDSSSKLPPSSGWWFPLEGSTEGWEETSFGFRAIEEKAVIAASMGDMARDPEEQREEARKALMLVDAAALRGLVKPHNPAMAAYFGHFVVLLHIEFLVELSALKKRLSRPVEDLKRLGWTLDSLTVIEIFEKKAPPKKSGHGLPGKAEDGSVKVSFSLGPGPLPQFLRIRNGDSVLLSRTNPMRDLIAEGSVTEAPREDMPAGAAGSRIVITFDCCDALHSGNSKGMWRLDKAANRIAYERQLLSLVKLVSAKEAQRSPMWELLPLSEVGTGNVDTWAERMRAMVDERQKAKLEGAAAVESCTATAQRASSASAKATKELIKLSKVQPDVARPAEKRAACKEISNSPDLNASQQAAITAAMGQRLTLIQGPPGTGKTHVSVRLLQIFSQQLQLWPLLATSDSNVAVDNIAEGLLQRGVKVIRVGQAEKVRSQHLDNVTLDTILRKRRAEQREKDKGKSAGKGKGKEFGDPEQERRRRMEDYEAKLAIVRDADVICCTTITSGSSIFESFKFAAILIDEVAQATELSAIVPIVLRSAERLILVGDHCQLPPSVCSLEAEMRGLSLSLFGRWAAQGVDPHFLDTQFRMHPMIADFSAKQFYHGRLKTGISAEARPAPAGFAWPQEGTGIAFVHVGTRESMDGESRANPGEADKVSDILARILALKELSVLDIGVVTPYAAQVRALRRKLQMELPRKLQGYDVDFTGGVAGMQGMRALEIASVDAFQGREKDLIVFSAVRSNAAGRVGFLADERRLNVMITRARRGLIVIGNTDTLRCDPTWGKWLDWADEQGLIMRKPERSQPQPQPACEVDDTQIIDAQPNFEHSTAVRSHIVAAMEDRGQNAENRGWTPPMDKADADGHIRAGTGDSRPATPADINIRAGTGDSRSATPDWFSGQSGKVLAVLIGALMINLYVLPTLKYVFVGN